MECESRIENTNACVFETLDGFIGQWSIAAQCLLGFTSEEIVGRSSLTLCPHDRRDEAFVLAQTVRRGKDVTRFCTVRMHKDGTLIPVLISRSAVVDGQGTRTGYIDRLEDVRPRLSHDPVLGNPIHYHRSTGLLTELGLKTYAESVCRREIANQATPYLILMSLDNLDHYTSVFGRVFVQRLIVKASVSLKLSLGLKDKLALCGDAQFLMFMQSDESVNDVLRRIVKDLLASASVDDTPVMISASAGIAFFGEHDLNFESVFQTAKDSMFPVLSAYEAED